MRRLGLAVATAGGAGYFPVAPGTVGSLVGLIVYLLARGMPVGWQLALLAVLVASGVWAGGVAASHFGREDPGQVVIDEVAGQFLTLLATSAGPWGIGVGFFLFRALDITKPWPARALERLPGGFGIMADDLMVGVYGNAILQLAQTVRPGFL